MLYEAIAIAIVLGFFTKGNIKNLTQLQFKYVGLVFLAFGLKYGFDFLAYKGYVFDFYMTIVMQLLAYMALFIFLYQNRKIPGTLIMFLGMLSNFLVIMANKGAMPSTTQGLDPFYIRLLVENKSATHVLYSSATKLPWLADIFTQTIPEVKKFSIGDVFISIGVFYLVWATMHTRQAAKNYRVDSFLSKSRL